MFQTEHLQEKWQPVLEHPDLNKIDDSYKRAVTTLILENQEKAMKEDRGFLSETAPTNSMGGGQMDTWDPILISLVRRAMPNLIAYDVCGVQPMTGQLDLSLLCVPHLPHRTAQKLSLMSHSLIHPTRTLPVQLVVVILLLLKLTHQFLMIPQQRLIPLQLV